MPVPLVVLNKYYSLTRLSDKALLKSLFRERAGKSQDGGVKCVYERASLSVSLPPPLFSLSLPPFLSL